MIEAEKGMIAGAAEVSVAGCTLLPSEGLADCELSISSTIFFMGIRC